MVSKDKKMFKRIFKYAENVEKHNDDIQSTLAEITIGAGVLAHMISHITGLSKDEVLNEIGEFYDKAEMIYNG